MSVLFATNIADPHHWTINTCFGAFCNVRVHLVPYRYRTKLGAKRAELEQLCEDSCHEVASEFFIMNAPDPCHWTLKSCFTSFLPSGCIWDRSLLPKTRRKRGWTGAINAKLCAMLEFFTTIATYLHHWTRNSNFCAFCNAWVHLGPFRHCMKLGAAH